MLLSTSNTEIELIGPFEVDTDKRILAKVVQGIEEQVELQRGFNNPNVFVTRVRMDDMADQLSGNGEAFDISCLEESFQRISKTTVSIRKSDLSTVMSLAAISVTENMASISISESVFPVVKKIAAAGRSETS